MRYSLTALVAAAIITPAAASAAPAGPSGYYYHVPVDVHKNAQGSYRDKPDEITSETAQLLVYNRDDGTTAVQLKVNGPPAAIIGQAPAHQVTGYTIHRDRFPAAAQYVFGALNSITIPFQPMNRHLQGQAANVVDLHGPDGQPVGDTYQFADASGEPLKNISVEYSLRSGMRADTTTGTVSLDAEGKFIIPRPKFLFQGGGYATPGLAGITFTEPESGTRLSLGNQMWQSFSRQPGTSSTVPFLNDWATPPSDVDVYAGQIFNDDDTPASGTKFTVYGHAYQRDPFESSSRDLTAGPGGHFQLAFQRPDQSGNPAALQFRGEPSITLRFEGSTQSHQLKPGREIQVRKKREATISLEFLNDKGEPLDFTTTPALAQLLPPHQTVGFIYGSSDASSRRPDMHYQLLVESGEVQPVQLIVPATYYAIARGYVFQEEQVDIGETSITFRPILADFELKGRITDLQGNPVADAFVMAFDASTFFSMSMLPAGEIVKMLNEAFTVAGGDFRKIGAYMAKTESDGSFELSGNTLSALSRLMIITEDYGDIVVAPLPEQMEIVKPALQNPSTIRPDMIRMEGKFDYGTIKLARQATATLTLKEVEPEETTRTYPMRGASVRAQFLETGAKPQKPGPLGLVDQHQWNASQSFEGEKLSLSVPAETTATIRIVSDRSGKPLQYNIDILDPLKPGEVRDLGVIEQKDGKPWEDE